MTDRAIIQSTHTREELTRFFVAMSLSSFAFHAIWEMSQMAAFKDLAGRPLLETAARCTPATLGDVVITFWIYAIGALAAKTLSWGLQPRWNVCLTLAVLGAVHAILIEQAAAASGRWSYTNSMPTIPPLGVGIWPVLQLVVLTPLTVWISSHFALKKRSRTQASDSSSL